MKLRLFLCYVLDGKTEVQEIQLFPQVEDIYIEFFARQAGKTF